MSVPHFRDKHVGRPYVTPHRLLAYWAEQGQPMEAAPKTLVVGWQNSLLTRVRETHQFQQIPGPPGSVVLRFSAEFGFARLPFGAPVVAIAAEEFAARGAETIVGVGTAGAIGGELELGEAVVCSSALRDEGTSHHYSPPGPWALPDPGLVEILRSALPDAAYGPTWTTDAPYRETVEEILAYQQEGVLTVDMEASALFTVGSCLGLRTASVFCVSDTLHGDEWKPHFHSADLDDALWRLFERVEAALVGAEPAATSIDPTQREPAPLPESSSWG